MSNNSTEKSIISCTSNQCFFFILGSIILLYLLYNKQNTPNSLGFKKCMCTQINATRWYDPSLRPSPCQYAKFSDPDNQVNGGCGFSMV
jgi:hypothetical protein